MVVRHRNELPVPTVVHLHGGHTPAEHDGWPLDLVLPVGDTGDWARHHGMVGDVAAGERDYRYPIDQRAATLWYHDHRMDFTGPAVYRGLAGFHLVRDEVEDALPLPRGDRELPLMICDRAFAADGSFAYPGLDQGMRSLPGVRGRLDGGGARRRGAGQRRAVAGARGRRRALPAAAAQRARTPAATGSALTVPAGPDLPWCRSAPTAACWPRRCEHKAIEIAPGERFDVVVDFSVLPVGTEVTMVNGLGDGFGGPA